MLLVVKNLAKHYSLEKSFFSNKTTTIKALDDINFQLSEGSVLGVVGETGSGKTTLAKLIVKLIKPSKGEIIYDSGFNRKSLQMIFQNPFNSLNPRMKIKNILKEPFLIYRPASRKDIDRKINILLEKVNLDYDCLQRYPDEFSGGQKQRIAIARAVSVEPKVLVCDEPTASLDLSVQAQILNLFVKIKAEFGLSYIFISHNIEVISFIADGILILYEGRQVEKGLKYKIFNNPLHPYTKILIGLDTYEIEKIKNDEGFAGCRFYPNCKFKFDICRELTPKEIEIEKGHYVSCHIFR